MLADDSEIPDDPTGGAAYCHPAAMRAWRAALTQLDSPTGLFRAAWAIARHEFPEADVAAGEAAVARLADTVNSRVRSRSVDARLAHLHDVLFEVAGFAGNQDNYYAPANSYLPEVLRTKRGLPITLTLIYQSVASRCGLTVYGVNAPGHFLAEVEVNGGRSMYVDPFFGGGALAGSEALDRIEQATGRPISEAAAPLARATPASWLARILANLSASFAMTNRQRDLLAMQELQAELATHGGVRP